MITPIYRLFANMPGEDNAKENQDNPFYTNLIW